MADATCSVEDDSHSLGYLSYGMCQKHYKRWQKHGDPLYVNPARRPGPPEERFWRFVNRDGPVPAHCPELGPCWLWTGGKMTSGYGNFGISKGNSTGAHRYAYELVGNVIPDGYEVDHLCHPDDGSCPGGKTDLHRLCVNPAHLSAVPQPENNRRSLSATALNARKTHCIHGHEFTEANTRIKQLPNGALGRDCRECAKERRVPYESNPRPEGWRSVLATANAAKTHCPHGHEYTPENTFYDKSSNGRRCRICMRAKSARSNEARRLAKSGKAA